MTQYVDEKGRLIFVSAGLGHEDYMTMYQDAGRWNASGAHRLKSKDLPVRGALEEAQADLDKYAKKKGWKVYCDKIVCPFHACMSNECTLGEVVKSAPHIVRKHISKNESLCEQLKGVIC